MDKLNYPFPMNPPTSIINKLKTIFIILIPSKVCQFVEFNKMRNFVNPFVLPKSDRIAIVDFPGNVNEKCFRCSIHSFNETRPEVRFLHQKIQLIVPSKVLTQNDFPTNGSQHLE